MDYSNNKSTSSTQQLFICFTSSSSMKMSSRSSILSPGRAGSTRDQPPTTLTTSLSRRLKHSRSIKGGASPAMFPTAGKKRGCGFDNPEPSSPKVTCIGQVRVKSKKKHAKNVNSLSSLRKFDHSRSQRQHLENNGINNGNNQKWVHIPMTICEALRTFGSEVSCLFPCRSSCSSNTGLEKEEKVDGGVVDRQGSCGAMVARWLVALQDGDGDRREMELVGGDDVDDVDGGNVRRHVFQDLEIVDDSIIGSMDEGRVSICVPPKNALLLMRCRSDPLMMEALANRFWEPSVDRNDEADEEFVDGEEEIEENKVYEEDVCVEKEEKVMALGEIIDQECENSEEVVEMNGGMEVKQSVQEEMVEMNLEIEAKQSVLEDIVEMNLETEKKESVLEENDQGQSMESNEQEESFYLESLFTEIEDQEVEEEEDEDDDDDDDDMEDAQEELFEDVEESEIRESNIEKVKLFEKQNQNMVTEVMSENETHEEIVMESEKVEQNEVVEKENEKKETNTSKPLPECLLLMMYEPKLSMEVSKETWVCSSDFIRRKSNRKKPPQPLQMPTQPLVKSIEGQDESKVNASSSHSGVTTKEDDNHVMRTSTVQNEPGLHQPARSSCSFPVRPSVAAVLEQKLVNTMGYEPLVLTRCKSEPMRTAAAKLKPDTCYWKNKLEPPRRASFGIGMAGLGF